MGRAQKVQAPAGAGRVGVLPDASRSMMSSGLLALILFCATQVLEGVVEGVPLVIAGGAISALVFLFSFLALGNLYIVMWGDSTPSTWSVVIVSALISQSCAIGIAPQANILAAFASAGWLLYLVVTSNRIYKQ